VLGEVFFTPRADQDICSIGDSTIADEIYRICEREIRVPAGESEIEGRLRGRPGHMWRRAIPISDLWLVEGYDIHDDDDFGRQACDYVIIYRLMDDEDKIRYKRKGDALLVLAVLHNREWVPYYLHQLPKLS
jgi:hypothetical protein